MQLRELQEATEASLKAAKEEKWTKDGEISTMRRSMAKVKYTCGARGSTHDALDDSLPCRNHQ